MQGLRKLRRVSWASDVNLCQVRLFLSEEPPSQVGLGTQDHLQAKPTWAWHSSADGSDDNLPPGFEGTQPSSLLKNKLSQIPVVEWTHPPRFSLASHWRVVAGEESKEVEFQNQREMRVLEAIYPRPSAIPLNPSEVSLEDSFDNDQDVPLVPVNPIEDEDAEDVFGDASAQNSVSPIQPQLLAHEPLAECSTSNYSSFDVTQGVEPDVVATAHAALRAHLGNNEQGNLIDQDLLVKILSDPKMIEQLTRHAAVSNSSTQSTASTSTPSMLAMGAQSLPNPVSTGINFPSPSVGRRDPHVSVSDVQSGMPGELGYATSSRLAGAIANPRPLVPGGVSAPTPSAGAPVARDIDYYKSLIQQHGGERQDNNMVPPFGSRRENLPRDSKPKIMKPCIYFNSSRGCRNGANCLYQHDVSPQLGINTMVDVQSSKRLKMDREITGS